MKVVDFNAEYKVGTGDIYLSIIIGDAQLGSSIVYVEDKEIKKGDINHEKIGSGIDLMGKKIKIKTVVTDVNDMSNYISVTYSLSGGASPLSITKESVVDEDGDSVIHRAVFSIKQ
jgi:hypothetical protein